MCVGAGFMKMVLKDVVMLASYASGAHFPGNNLKWQGINLSVTLQPLSLAFLVHPIIAYTVYPPHMVHLLGMTEQK